MIRMDMEYFNTYYFCSVAEYLIIEHDLDYVRTLGEFTDLYSGMERENFRKSSYLHEFVTFMVERIFFEQNKYFALRVEQAVIAEAYEDVFEKKGTVFFRREFGLKDNYNYTMFELAIAQYTNTKERMRDWIIENYKEDIDGYDIACLYTQYLEEKYWETVIEKVIKEVVYLLFQNRNFLLHFNVFLSDTLGGKSNRVTIPRWVQRAVYHRDKGRCVICQKDLSGLIDIEENFEKQLDHIVPLEDGGANDISNMQLMCKDCNVEKGIKSYTSNIYRFWYDDEHE